ncbi:MAG: hypothetical protein GY854_06055 [Deltaproteobacteria bacterium]|nr:hypothetical protein [Deltaproteobacteria bacterium]
MKWVSIIRFFVLLLATCGVLVLVSGCYAEEGDDSRGLNGSDGDADADSDTDTDADGGSDGDVDGDADGDADNGKKGCSAMDILFVIDDSGSMDCEQSKLGAAFPGFIDVLEQYNNINADQIDYRVGVTTTGRSVRYKIKVPGFPEIPMNEPGRDGRLVDVPGETSPWIDGPDPNKNLGSVFQQMASVGTSGPSYEMPLASLRLALEKVAPGEPNEGFLREEALFVVVIITDEDDCSRPDGDNDFSMFSDDCMAAPLKHNLVDLGEFQQILESRFGEGGYVVVTIAGASDCEVSGTMCSANDNYGGAMLADRLIDFTENYIGTEEGRNGVFADLCTIELPTALEQALDKMEVVCDEYTGPVL